MYTNDVIKKNYSSISILPKRNVFYFFLSLPSGLSFPGCACIDTRARFKKALNLSLSCIIKELIYCIYLEKIQNIRAMRREFSRSLCARETSVCCVDESEAKRFRVVFFLQFLLFPGFSITLFSLCLLLPLVVVALIIIIIIIIILFIVS